MNTRELKTRSKERKKSDSESKCCLRSPEEGKQRTSASSLKTAYKSTSQMLTKEISMKAAIMETTGTAAQDQTATSTNKMASTSSNPPATWLKSAEQPFLNPQKATSKISNWTLNHSKLNSHCTINISNHYNPRTWTTNTTRKICPSAITSLPKPWAWIQTDQSIPETSQYWQYNWRDLDTAALSAESWESSRTKRDCQEASKRYSFPKKKRDPKMISTKILCWSSQSRNSSALQQVLLLTMLKLAWSKTILFNHLLTAIKIQINNLLSLKLMPKITKLHKINQVWAKKLKLVKLWEAES